MAQTSQHVKFHIRFSQKRWHRHFSWSFCCTLHMSRKKVFIFIYIYIKIEVEKVFKNWFLHLLERSWFWRQLFFYSKFQLGKHSKIEFFNFWHDLCFGGILFLSNIELKQYSKIDFLTFWHDLGSGGSFFLFNIEWKKVFKIDFLRLLFPWRLDRWHKHLKMWNGGTTEKIFKNCFFPAFGTIMVLAAAFFLFNI